MDIKIKNLIEITLTNPFLGVVFIICMFTCIYCIVKLKHKKKNPIA